MTTDDIETVIARAMHRRQFYRDFGVTEATAAWEALPERAKQNWCGDARAVLSALKERGIAESLLDAMPDLERSELVRKYCPWCGDKGGCYCHRED